MIIIICFGFRNREFNLMNKNLPLVLINILFAIGAVYAQEELPIIVEDQLVVSPDTIVIRLKGFTIESFDFDWSFNFQLRLPMPDIPLPN